MLDETSTIGTQNGWNIKLAEQASCCVDIALSARLPTSSLTQTVKDIINNQFVGELIISKRAYFFSVEFDTFGQHVQVLLQQ